MIKIIYSTISQNVSVSTERIYIISNKCLKILFGAVLICNYTVSKSIYCH